MSKSYNEEMGFSPLEVVVEHNNFERAFRKFKSMVQLDGILVEYKERRFFEKTSDKRRRKRKQNQRRILSEK